VQAALDAVRQLGSSDFVTLAAGVYERLHGGTRQLRVPTFAHQEMDLHTVGVVCL
jgi:hypothetical protein